MKKQNTKKYACIQTKDVDVYHSKAEFFFKKTQYAQCKISRIKAQYVQAPCQSHNLHNLPLFSCIQIQTLQNSALMNKCQYPPVMSLHRTTKLFTRKIFLMTFIANSTLPQHTWIDSFFNRISKVERIMFASKGNMLINGCVEVELLVKKIIWTLYDSNYLCTLLFLLLGQLEVFSIIGACEHRKYIYAETQSYLPQTKSVQWINKIFLAFNFCCNVTVGNG